MPCPASAVDGYAADGHQKNQETEPVAGRLRTGERARARLSRKRASNGGGKPIQRYAYNQARINGSTRVSLRNACKVRLLKPAPRKNEPCAGGDVQREPACSERARVVRRGRYQREPRRVAKRIARSRQTMRGACATERRAGKERREFKRAIRAPPCAANRGGE